MEQRVVVCAAIRSSEGKVICGARHFDDIMRAQAFPNGKREGEWISADQGFIDQFGEYMSRSEAWDVAEAAGQIKYQKHTTPGTLYSEDLY